MMLQVFHFLLLILQYLQCGVRIWEKYTSWSHYEKYLSELDPTPYIFLNGPATQTFNQLNQCFFLFISSEIIYIQSQFMELSVIYLITWYQRLMFSTLGSQSIHARVDHVHVGCQSKLVRLSTCTFINQIEDVTSFFFFQNC